MSDTSDFTHSNSSWSSSEGSKKPEVILTNAGHGHGRMRLRWQEKSGCRGRLAEGVLQEGSGAWGCLGVPSSLGLTLCLWYHQLAPSRILPANLAFGPNWWEPGFGLWQT